MSDNERSFDPEKRQVFKRSDVVDRLMANASASLKEAYNLPYDPGHVLRRIFDSGLSETEILQLVDSVKPTE